MLGAGCRAPDSATYQLEEAASTWLEVIAEPGDPIRDLPRGMGAGETATLSLARKLQAEKVVLDDLSARRLARRVGFDVIGTVGILLAARLEGRIPRLLRELDRLREAGFFISELVIQAVAQAAGEHLDS